MEARKAQNLKMADSRSEFIRLKNVDSSFQNRSNSIFDKLSSLEPANENSSASIGNETRRKKQEDTNKSRNISPRSGGSKRLPARVPQHVLSPEKWTKYSLENDGTENLKGINEHSLNMFAAHSFLADLKKRKSCENSNDKSLNCLENITTETKRGNVQSDQVTANEQTSKTYVENDEVLRSENDSKFLFKKPEQKIEMTSSSTAGVWKDGTYIMPEYEVGSAKPKASPRQGNSLGKKLPGKGSVNLSHLEDEVEDGVAVGVQEGNKKGKRNFRKRKMDDETKDDCEKNTD